MDIFIKKILLTGIKEETVDVLLNNYIEHFNAVFVTKEVNPVQNYEYFEQLGDLCINKFIVNYASRKFPQLKNSNGVAVLASLRILYGSKETLSTLSERYGFDKYVKTSKYETTDKNKYMSILEDVFEAFFGATEYCVDDLSGTHGLGYIAVSNILKKMFDDLNMNIDYNNLVDFKSQLNEIKDNYKLKLQYVDSHNNNNFKSNAYINDKLAGVGEGVTKKQAQIEAAKYAIEWLEKNMNIYKKIPDRYTTFDSFHW